jgi:hypothetical protein
LPSVDTISLGDVGESPLHAENSVASVALDATWHAFSQNRRRETDVFVADIARSL